MTNLFDAPPDLDRLRAFLASDDAPERWLSLSGLDGFLAAVAIGPELLMPSEWLPYIWHESADPDGGPQFADTAEAGAILGAIMGRYNEILRLLQNDPERYAPIVERSPDVARDGLEWGGGFLRGMQLRAEAWGDLLGDPEERWRIEPILLLCNTPKGNPFYDVPAEEVDAVHAEALEVAPRAVSAIAEYWREVGTAPPQRPARSAKIGRNEPCPCGSGKKHKKCCGAG